MLPVRAVGQDNWHLRAGVGADDIGVELDAVTHRYGDIPLDHEIIVRLDAITKSGMLAFTRVCDAFAPDHVGFFRHIEAFFASAGERRPGKATQVDSIDSILPKYMLSISARHARQLRARREGTLEGHRFAAWLLCSRSEAPRLSKRPLGKP